MVILTLFGVITSSYIVLVILWRCLKLYRLILKLIYEVHFIEFIQAFIITFKLTEAFGH